MKSQRPDDYPLRQPEQELLEQYALGWTQATDILTHCSEPTEIGELTPGVILAFKEFNKKYGTDYLPIVTAEAVLDQSWQQTETTPRHTQNRRHVPVSPWAAGFALIVAVAAVSAGVNHIRSSEDRPSIDAAYVPETEYPPADLTNIDDRCFDDPTKPTKKNGLNIKGDTMYITKDIQEVVVGGVNFTMEVKPGVHVGLAAICGAGVALHVEGHVDTAYVFGAVSELAIDGDGTIGGGAIGGGNCRIDEQAAKTVVGSNCNKG